MAEKIFTNVRLGLKVDTLENWKSSSLVLKRGEVAFATVAASEGTGLTEPVVMMKIGDGEKTFSQLGFDFYAKASDVVAAAKSEASLKTFINGVIADAGIATNDAMEALAGRVTTAEGEIDALQADLNTESTGLKARVTTAEGAIDALEALVGDKKVATQISEAIAALNLDTTYAAKSLETTVANHTADTVAHVTAEDKVKWNNALQNTDIVAGSANGTISVKGNDVAVKGLGSAAYTDSAAYDASGSAAAAEAAAKAYADGLAGNYDSKGSAAAAQSAAETYAKNYADGLAGNYDASGSAADALDDAKAYTDAEIDEWVGGKTVGVQISEAITGLDLPNTYDAKGAAAAVDAKLTTHASEAAAAYETKTDATAKLTEAKGYTDTEVAKVQGEVDALETYVGTIPETAEATNIVAYIQEKTAGIATDTALEELTGRVADAEGEIDDLQAELDTADTGLKARMTAAEGAIDAIEADYLKAADKTALQDQITELDGLVGDKAVSEQITDVTNPLDARIKAVEDDYLTSADEKALQDQITANANAITLLTNGASADEVDGVNDLIQYVKDHGTEVTGIKADIKDNADAIAAIEADYLKAADKTELSNAIAAEKERAEGIEGGLDNRLQAVEAAVGETGSVATAIEGAVTEAKGYTDAEVKKLSEGAVADNTAAIGALETLVGEKPVAEQITDVTDDLDSRIDALEAIDHEHTNKTVLDGIEEADVTAWDAKVDDVTAAADSGLKATRTGNTVAIEIDDSITFVFDCGDAEVTA